MQALPGFRDFFPAECAARNYIFAQWRAIARRYGFVEYAGPALEPTELYRKKSGDEIVSQLFHFTDKGGREVALRPELTPTLARMAAARARDFRKPLKWFSIAECFRYEKQQKGRLREHLQLNCDIIGEAAAGADAELIALVIDVLRGFGLTAKDFVVRLSDRRAWLDFLQEKTGDVARANEFLQVIDKMEREKPEVTAEKLRAFGISPEEVRAFIGQPAEEVPAFQTLAADLRSRGLTEFYELDLTIVRGLSYYTGVVFEVFDRERKFRAIAGGGRYDTLIESLSDGAMALPALGFAMGDVVLGELLATVPAAHAQLEQATRTEQALDIYVVIAKEERRTQALAAVQALRDRGWRADYPLSAAKVGKQFQTAEAAGASLALLFGDEWPQVKMKVLATRDERLVAQEDLLAAVAQVLAQNAPA